MQQKSSRWIENLALRCDGLYSCLTTQSAARLDALRGKLDELQRLQREVAAELASFTPALLAKAFRGEL